MVAAQIHDADDRPEPRQHVGYRHLRTETVRWMKCARSNHKEEQMRNAGVHERCLQPAERLSSILGAVRDCRRRCSAIISCCWAARWRPQLAHSVGSLRRVNCGAIGGIADMSRSLAARRNDANDPKRTLAAWICRDAQWSPQHGRVRPSGLRSCPKLRGELVGRRTLANEKMVNRVGRHKCGVTLWQMWLLPRVAKRHLDCVEVPPDGLEHNFGCQRVYWLENSIFKAPYLTVDQSRRWGVKSLEQFISASRRSSCPKHPRDWSRATTDRHDTPHGCDVPQCPILRSSGE